MLRQFPNSFNLYSLLSDANAALGRLDEAIDGYKKALKIGESHPQAFITFNNLGLALQQSGDPGAAADNYRQVIKLRPDLDGGYYNLGNALHEQGDLDAAIDSYRQALKIKPDHVLALNNMGNAFKRKGDLDAALDSYRQAISINPDYAEGHNNIGTILHDKRDMEAAIASFIQAVKIRPDFAEAYWNLGGTSDSVEEAEQWLGKCLAADPQHDRARITHAALKYYLGDSAEFDALLQSGLKNHPYTRSCKWLFSLPELPALYFNGRAVFDAVIEQSKKDRPFYEFGVWRGEAFRYLVKTFKKGYGFDTFSGLPEDWDNNKAGSYSSDGNIPDIEGGEFIVGKFEDSLPAFFSEPRPMASLINYDADLYSSTICALNYSKPVIDQHTILIFDELIVNENWEQDEFKALNEFCAANDCTYEVLAASIFTKQVAVRLIGI